MCSGFGLLLSWLWFFSYEEKKNSQRKALVETILFWRSKISCMLSFCDNLLTNSSKGFQFLNKIGLKLSFGTLLFGTLLVGNLVYLLSLIFVEKLQKAIQLHFLVFKFRGIELTFFLSKAYFLAPPLQFSLALSKVGRLFLLFLLFFSHTPSLVWITSVTASKGDLGEISNEMEKQNILGLHSNNM